MASPPAPRSSVGFSIGGFACPLLVGLSVWPLAVVSLSAVWSGLDSSVGAASCDSSQINQARKATTQGSITCTGVSGSSSPSSAASRCGVVLSVSIGSLGLFAFFFFLLFFFFPRSVARQVSAAIALFASEGWIQSANLKMRFGPGH